MRLLALALYSGYAPSHLTHRAPTAHMRFRIAAPCTPADAAALLGDAIVHADADADADADASVTWVAVYDDEPPKPLELNDFTGSAPLMPPPAGVPVAVGRLRTAPSPLLDRLSSALEKEAPDFELALMAALDALLLQWLEVLESGSSELEYESLRACANVHTAKLLERRGFAEIDRPDMSQRPIATHHARLPAAILACDFESQSKGDDEGVLLNLLARLRAQPAPTACIPS